MSFSSVDCVVRRGFTCGTTCFYFQQYFAKVKTQQQQKKNQLPPQDKTEMAHSVFTFSFGRFLYWGKHRNPVILLCFVCLFISAHQCAGSLVVFTPVLTSLWSHQRFAALIHLGQVDVSEVRWKKTHTGSLRLPLLPAVSFSVLFRIPVNVFASRDRPQLFIEGGKKKTSPGPGVCFARRLIHTLQQINGLAFGSCT